MTFGDFIEANCLWEGRLSWNMPSFIFRGFDRSKFGFEERGFYESDPIFDVLLQIANERCVWPSSHFTSDGLELALAFLAAEE